MTKPIHSTPVHQYAGNPLPENKDKEEAIKETIEQTFIIPGLSDNDASYIIFNYATNGGLDSKTLCSMLLVNSTWLRAFNTTMLPLFWGSLEKKTQNNPLLGSIIQQINTNVSLAQHKIFITLFVDSVINNSALPPGSGEVDPSEENSLSDAARSIGPSYFSRFSDLTDELRKKGAPILKEHAVLGFNHDHYAKMQQRLDSSLETIWTRIQGNINFQGEPIPTNAQAIRTWLNDPANEKKLARITRLDLSQMNLTILPLEIGKISRLDELHLQDNQLSSLPETIGNLSELKLLYLYRNRLKSLPETIDKLINLQVLDLGDNQLQSLPEGISHCTSLQKLFLYKNQLRSIPKTIGTFSSLVTLDLSHNELNFIPETIGKLSLLSIFSTYGLSQDQISEIQCSLVGPVGLQLLDLSYNRLSSLPEAFSTLSQLKMLNLSGNPLLFNLDENFYERDLDQYNTFATLKEGVWIKKTGLPDYTDPLRPVRDAFASFEKTANKLLACSNHKCSTPLASLCQAIHRGADNNVLQDAFGQLSEPMQQGIRQAWAAIPSSSSSSSEAGADLFADRATFTQAVITAMQNKWQSLSEAQRNQAHFHVWRLAERPQDEDPRWGETHAADNIIRLIDAMELATQK